MAKPPAEGLVTFRRRQDAADLVAVLLEFAEDHDAVQARIARIVRVRLADRSANALAWPRYRWGHLGDGLATSAAGFFAGFAPSATAVGTYDRKIPIHNPTTRP